jgi:hypothetical protein
MMPALLIKTCNGRRKARNSVANAPTDASDARSSSRNSIASLPVSLRSVAATSSPFERSRVAITTRAPAAASARTVSTPMPEAPPVTIASRPLRS